MQKCLKDFRTFVIMPRYQSRKATIQVTILQRNPTENHRLKGQGFSKESKLVMIFFHFSPLPNLFQESYCFRNKAFITNAVQALIYAKQSMFSCRQLTMQYAGIITA